VSLPQAFAKAVMPLAHEYWAATSSNCWRIPFSECWFQMLLFIILALGSLLVSWHKALASFVP
jgi:hypothetical protein